MAISIGDAILKLGIDSSDLDKGLSGLRGKIEQHKKAIGVTLLGISTAVIAGAIASVKAYADMGSAVYDMSKRTGLGTEAISELKYAAEQSGASLGGLEVSIRRMSSVIVDAGKGTNASSEALKRLGITALDLKGMKPEDQFMKIAMALASVEDPTLKSAIAVDIFGRSGTDLLPLLAEGADGISKLRQEARDMGIVFSEEAAASADKLGDAFNKLNNQITGLKFTVAAELLPSIEYMIPLLTDWAKALGPILENTLNWNAAYDEQVAIQGAWQSVMLQRRRALDGLTNDYGKAIDALESMLREQGLWNEQANKTVASLRAEADAHRKVTEAVIEKNTIIAISKQLVDGAIVSTNLYTLAEVEAAKAAGLLIETLPTAADAVREFEQATKDADKAIKNANESFMGMMDRIKYTGTEAAKFGITMFDIYDAMDAQGFLIDEIREKWNLWGDDIGSIEGALKFLGLTAKEVNEILKGIQEGRVTVGRERTGGPPGQEEALEKMMARTPEETASLEAALKAAEDEYAALKASYAASSYEQQMSSAWNAPFEAAAKKITDANRRLQGVPGYQYGGIIPEPTLLYGLRSMRPYAVAGEAGIEHVVPDRGGGGFKVADLRIYLDGRILAEKLGVSLVDIIRLKTGVRI